MPPPIPRCSSGAYSSLNSPSHFSLPRYGSRVGLHIVLFEACSTFTRVAACTLALSPIRDTLIEGFSHFVTSMTAPIASGWSDCRVGLAPTGKRRLCTAHATSRHWSFCSKFAGNHLRRCGERTRAHYVLFEDRVRIVDFNERYVIAPEIGQVLKHPLRIPLVQLGSFHYGMAQHQAAITRKINIDHFYVGVDETNIVLP